MTTPFPLGASVYPCAYEISVFDTQYPGVNGPGTYGPADYVNTNDQDDPLIYPGTNLTEGNFITEIGAGENYEDVNDYFYCAEHQYRYEIQCCVSYEWLTAACGNGSYSGCQTVIIGGRTKITAEIFPKGNLWDLIGDCQCGGFYSTPYDGGSIIFRTGPGQCDDLLVQKGASWNAPGAVCVITPAYNAISYDIVKTEILDQYGNVLGEVDYRDFPHTGFTN